MDLIDEFQWRISHVEGVRSTISLPQAARILAAAWSEGSPVWRELPRNQDVLMQSLVEYRNLDRITELGRQCASRYDFH